MSDQRKQTIELRDLVLAVKDVTEWYDLGVRLALPIHMLDTIKAERLPVQESMREMLKKWLDYDPEASWEKLVSALEAIDKKAVADSVRSGQAVAVRGPTTQVVERDRAEIVNDDAETRLAMNKRVLRRIKGSFSLLLIEVQSSLEKHKVKAKTVRKFFHHFFEGECSIPNVPDMDEVFESMTSAKLWRFDHYGPLQEMAESLLPGDNYTRGKIAEYIRQLSAYYATASIIDHLQAHNQEDLEEDNQVISPKKYNRRYRKLTVKVKVDPSVPMEYVEKLWKSLMQEFHVPPLSAIIDKIQEGSLTITWLVLPHVASKIKATYFRSVNFFQLSNITDIWLSGHILYREEWMEGSTLLYRASYAGDIEEVKTLVHKGSEDINQQNHNADGDTPLIGACMGSGDVNIVRLLLEKGADIDGRSKNEGSPLMTASLYGLTDVVRLLMEYKPDVNLQADNGNTALIFACTMGTTDIVKLLLIHGAVVDYCETENEISALAYASIYGNIETVKVLVQYGASLDLIDGQGLTALMWASSCGQSNIARALLEERAAIDIKNNDGKTALWYASVTDHPETVKVLLDFGAEVDVPFDVEDGGTALTVASREGYTQVVKMLLFHRSLVNYQDKKGQTPLHHASAGGHDETVMVLLDNKAEVDLQNEEGWTAVFLAAKLGHKEVTKTLLDHGAAVDIKSKTGLTAIDVARAESHQAVCEVIEQHLNQWAKVNPKQTGGQESQDQVGESGQDSKTELTVEQRSEVTSVSERLWYQFKRVFLRKVIKKKEHAGQLHGDPSHRTIDQYRGRRSILDLNLFNWPGRRRRETKRHVVGTASAPEQR